MSIESHEVAEAEAVKQASLMEMDNYLKNLINHGVEERTAAQRTIDLYQDLQDLKEELEQEQ